MAQTPKIETKPNKYKLFYDLWHEFLQVQEDDMTIHPETTIEEITNYLDNYIKTHDTEEADDASEA